MRAFNVSLIPDYHYLEGSVVERGKLLDLSDLYGYNVSVKVAGVVRGILGTLQILIVKYFFSHRWIPITLVSNDRMERVLVSVTNLKERLSIDLNEKTVLETFEEIANKDQPKNLIDLILKHAEMHQKRKTDLYNQKWENWILKHKEGDIVLSSLSDLEMGMLSQEDVNLITYQLSSSLNVFHQAHKILNDISRKNIEVGVDIQQRKIYVAKWKKEPYSVKDVATKHIDINYEKKTFEALVRDLCKVTERKMPQMQSIPRTNFSHAFVSI